ncbi:MAG: Hsp20/alpha crystallin family protein [Deltaproteobacteria bacterium]|nr:Hsp20/alpha crystallin family protein [Deltaproteobacteria bacterium]MBW1918624.1 Hsp20/alpha crystallin family protein [Deltaproteobacteria bacterium]MBW1934064.1 Hsp20/alpha crystallin family protein [Deltaproteobacteria bacterium]MBW1976364.1 Hsp20/alpha crystallin family protein [Deltaproteobacteria bacterium]MBW2043358.1 Hsp20/alpha crystallin family protein [Deltaproteobacteria bacterium]
MADLIPWRGEIDRLRDEMDRLYERLFDWMPFRRFPIEGEWVPSVDVSETAKNIVVSAEIPGMDAKDIEVSLDGNVLTLRGERKQQKEEKEENFHRVERVYGSFFRSIQVPAEVDSSKVKASYKRGVLKITLPKVKKQESKKIEVKTV